MCCYHAGGRAVEGIGVCAILPLVDNLIPSVMRSRTTLPVNPTPHTAGMTAYLCWLHGTRAVRSPEHHIYCPRAALHVPAQYG